MTGVRNLVVILVMAILAGCGGGGGGGGGGASAGNTGSTQPEVPPALTFSTPVLKATFASQSFTTFPVTGSIARPSDFDGATKVYVLVVDDKGVLSPTVNAAVSGTSFSAILSPSTSLAAGLYTGSLSVKLCRDASCASQFPGSPVSLPYEFHVAPAGYPTFAANVQSPLVARMHYDGQAPASATVTLQATGRSWTGASTAPWAKLDKTSGSGDATLKLSYDSTGLAVGEHTATLTFTGVDGITSTLPVSLTIDPYQHKILASEVAVAFTSTPARSRLTRSLTVVDNLGKDVAWSATSDQRWLNVTGSGRTGGANSLTLTADPAALVDGSTSYATVTLASSDPGVSAPEPIRVALWKGGSLGSAGVTVSTPYQKIVADPLRPLVYVHNGANALDIYNVHTGQMEGSVTGLPAKLGEMSVSADGARLYVAEANDNVIVIDLATRATAAAWPLLSSGKPNNGFTLFLKSVRPNGVEVVLASDGSAFIAATGKRLDKTSFDQGRLTASADGHLVAQLPTVSSSAWRSYNLDVIDAEGGSLLVTPGAYLALGGDNPRGIALTADGSRAYGAFGSPYHCVWASTSDPKVNGALVGDTAYPNNVQVGSDGRVYCGRESYYDPIDIMVYDRNGTFIRNIEYLPANDGQLVISGDGLVAAGVYVDYMFHQMKIAPVDP